MKRIALVALVVMVSACSLFPKQPAPPSLHDFGPAAGGGEAVTVDAPEWLRDERMRYRLLYADPTQVRFYAHERWLASPPALLGQRLAVARDGQAWRLHVRLTDFEQIFDTPASARVVLRLKAVADQPDGPIRLEKSFDFSRPCPSADVAGAVAAFAEAVDEAASVLKVWLAGLPAR